jgi:hypothetical protein
MTEKLDTIEIADELGRLAEMAAVLAAAGEGLRVRSDSTTRGGVIALADELRDAIEELSRKIHPGPDEDEEEETPK